jgi:hypothetical protein
MSSATWWLLLCPGAVHRDSCRSICQCSVPQLPPAAGQCGHSGDGAGQQWHGRGAAQSVPYQQWYGEAGQQGKWEVLGLYLMGWLCLGCFVSEVYVLHVLVELVLGWLDLAGSRYVGIACSCGMASRSCGWCGSWMTAALWRPAR